MSRKFAHSFVVCTCKNVTLGELVYAIEKKDAKSIKDLGKFTDAGTCCKSCQTKTRDSGERKMSIYLDEILNKVGK